MTALIISFLFLGVLVLIVRAMDRSYRRDMASSDLMKQKFRDDGSMDTGR